MDFLAYLQASPVNTVALGGLVTLMVLSLIRGWVVPRSVLVDRVADKDARIAEVALERDQWKAAYDKAELSRQELERQNSSLIQAGETTNRLIDSLRSNLENSP